jgi:hypothetical protein
MTGLSGRVEVDSFSQTAGTVEGFKRVLTGMQEGCKRGAREGQDGSRGGMG